MGQLPENELIEKGMIWRLEFVSNSHIVQGLYCNVTWRYLLYLLNILHPFSALW